MDPFVTKVAASGVVGGVWIAGATFCAERFGSKVGGLIAGLPATAPVALFFIAVAQGPKVAFDAATAFPLAMAANVFFLISFLLLAQRGLPSAIAGSILIWCGAQGLLFMITPSSFEWAIGVWSLIVVSGICLLMGPLRVRPSAGVELHHSLFQMLGRAVFGGAIVGSAVILSRFGGALLGGVFSTFPAVIVSTLLVTSKTIDLEFSQSIVPALLVSSEINCVAFSVGFRFIVQTGGPLEALVIAYGFSIVAGAGSLLLVRTLF